MKQVSIYLDRLPFFPTFVKAPPLILFVRVQLQGRLCGEFGLLAKGVRSGLGFFREEEEEEEVMDKEDLHLVPTAMKDPALSLGPPRRQG